MAPHIPDCTVYGAQQPVDVSVLGLAPCTFHIKMIHNHVLVQCSFCLFRDFDKKSFFDKQWNGKMFFFYSMHVNICNNNELPSKVTS